MKKELTANQLLDAVDDARDRLAVAVRTRKAFIRAWACCAVVAPSGVMVALVFDPNSEWGGFGIVLALVALFVAFILGCFWLDNMMTGEVHAARKAVKAAERAHRDFEGPYV